MLIERLAFQFFVRLIINRMEHSQSLILEREQNQEVSDWKEFLSLVYKGENRVRKLDATVEKVLISRLSTGDRSAFSIIFSAYYKDLVLFAASYIHNQDAAEEIVQDTFVKLWDEHESFQIDKSLKSYLLATVRNRCFNWCRHKKIMQLHADNAMNRTPCFSCDTDNYLLFSELQERLDTALEKLPDVFSVPFKMNRNQGLKYHEIADILGVSVRTIEVRIGKALHALRNHLGEYFQVILVLISVFLCGQ